MEACKKIPCMINFELKNSPEATSFHNLKQCIAEYYGEDPDSYSKEFRELEELRGLACRPRTDMDCCSTIKRYYSQLHSLQNRFPLSSDTELLNFAWKDIYSGSVIYTSNIRFEMASTLYNIAVLHSKLGVEEERSDAESMKLACTHFQCAAWAFGEVKNQYGLFKGDLSAELMIYMQQICFAQAQECILEKSLADNRKAAIIAKVTAQVISFYNAAMSALFSQNEDGTIQDLIGSKLYKEWLKYIKFKTSYLSSILFLYQGQNSEEQRKMGERVALYNAACDRLEEAKKEMKGMHRAEAIAETLSLATDIMEGKRKNAKQENEFIYHEAIPDVSTISAVQGANLVHGIPFDVTDSEIIGEDIFKRLVPMKTHENLSLYSEEKANILRQLGAKIDERDAELAHFLGSLNIDLLNSMKTGLQEKLPQNLVDRCAELSGKPNAISDLVESMSNLANICTEVEVSLNEIKSILDEEAVQEQNFQKQMGKRPTGHMTELTREFTKYNDAHIKAGESNDTLRKAMELHVSNLKILSQPLSVLKDQVPQSETVEEEVRKELENLLNKVEQMKSQRDTIYNELRDQILNKDDITAQLVAHGDKDVEELFKKELKKYSHSVNIIEQNLVAQGNILKALMDTYAKHAMRLKAFNDTKSKREQFFAGLIGSYDVYEDLISKSAKGVDFYKKLHTNIQKLLSRVKAARDVQEEERQQLLKNAMAKAESAKIETFHKTSIPSSASMPSYPNNLMHNSTNHSNTITTHQTSGGSSGLKLKDYIKSGMVPNISNLRDESKIPAVRPSPVGQETIPQTNLTPCSNVSYPMTQMPNVSAFGSQYYPQQQQQQVSNMIYQNQQQYFPQNDLRVNVSNENKNIVSSSNTLNYSSNYNSPIYGQTTTVQGNQANITSGISGYVNPIYNQSENQIYQDRNAYNSMNYSPANTYQQPQQQPSPQISTSYAYYNQPQQVTPNQIAPQIHTPSSTINAQQITQNPIVSQIQTPTSLVTGQTNFVQAPQTNQSNPIQSSTNMQTSMTHPPQSQQNISYSSTTSSPNQLIYQNTQANSGEFIQNIYKSQLQYPKVQNSSIQQYPITSTPLSGGVGNQYSYNQNQSVNQTSYGQQQQQNYSCGQQHYGTNNQQVYYSSQNSSTNPISNNYTNATSIQNTTQTTQAYNVQPYLQNVNSVASPQIQTSAPMTSSNNTPATVSNNTQVNESSQKGIVPQTSASKSANMDLLSGIDFSVSSIDSIPTLTPISIVAKKEEEKPDVKSSPKKNIIESTSVVQTVTPIKMNDDLKDLDFSSLSVSKIIPETISLPEIKKPQKFEDPFENVNVLKQFHKEVESLEKYMETLTIKTLSGITPLANKWKELQDLLVKDESKRSISVAKLFPEKNRYNDFLPYDHGRVQLPTATDNYINAVLVKNCGPIPFIMAQIPMENTINDWWEMLWSQKSNIIVCLHSESELLDPFWPQNINEEKNYGEISVILQKQFELSHCFEKQLKVTHHGSDKTTNISLLQVKSWKKKSPDQIVDISNNIITSFKQMNSVEKQYAPIILNCISGGSERSGLITLGISAILATQMSKPILLNVVDHWFRVCSQRKGVLEDENSLQISLQVVLNNAHRILNKRGIMTSYQVKNAEKLSSPIETEKTVKDSLQELDPFWKFK
ncbi:hypothetical protein PVAND_010828 [Polypedilum vanderplanki]|uniref:Tyrosine-protein phosphatase non-receptor type 23 n=1 Tax=Polypedilum vanderplanki TaxID=319348 RepID=A0A9J6CGR2_POLVA|nr:hypothetical protein PVAND_010828 [Polypedilum vanderplanki]